MESLSRKILSPVARLIARVIASNRSMLDLYRSFDFKGKLFISGFIDISIQNGIYKCRGLNYSINFTDQIQEMVYFGTYERQELSFLRNYVKKNWICLDIGANIGFYTLNLSKLVGESGKVYALEPSESNFKKLEENIKINELNNCVTSKLALSSEIGDSIFSVSPSQNSGWGRLGKWKSSQSEIVVNVSTLDQFVEDRNISRIDFLKIDIEGHELEFIKGAENSFKNGIVNRMMIEYCGYSLEPKGITLKHYIDRISELGYVPVFLNMRKVEEASKGIYQHRKEVMNLLFDRLKD